MFGDAFVNFYGTTINTQWYYINGVYSLTSFDYRAYLDHFGWKPVEEYIFYFFVTLNYSINFFLLSYTNICLVTFFSMCMSIIILIYNK